MRSGSFSNVSINTHPDYQPAPILLDHVAIKLMIYVREYNTQANPKTGSAFPPNLIKRVPDPLAAYVANPRIYKHRKGAPIIFVCGQEALTSNGTRLFSAEIGNPLPHCTSRTGLPRKESVQRYEGANNYFSESLLQRLLGTQGCDPLNPHQYLLGIFLHKYFQIRDHIISAGQLQNFNTLGQVKRDLRFYSMELYIEVPYSNRTDVQLVAAFKELFTRCFGQPDKHRRRTEESLDKKDSDALLSWVVLPKLVSPNLADGRDYLVKVYKKQGKVRIEIQANSPALDKELVGQTTSSECQENADFNLMDQLGIIPTQSTYSEFADVSSKVANEIATKLRELEQHAWALLSKQVEGQDWLDTYEQMLERCRSLKPRLIHDDRFISVLKHIAQHGYIDIQTCRSLKLKDYHLKDLATEGVGFLRRENKGIAALSAQAYTGTRNPNFVLVADWISRTAPLEKKRSKKSTCSDCDAIAAMPSDNLHRINEISVRLEAMTNLSHIDSIISSAIPIDHTSSSIVARKQQT